MLCGESPVAWAMCVRRFAAVFLLVCLWPAAAADLSQARKLFVSGDYSECIRLSEQALRDEGAVAIFRDPSDLLERHYQPPLAG